MYTARQTPAVPRYHNTQVCAKLTDASLFFGSTRYNGVLPLLRTVQYRQQQRCGPAALSCFRFGWDIYLCEFGRLPVDTRLCLQSA